RYIDAGNHHEPRDPVGAEQKDIPIDQPRRLTALHVKDHARRKSLWSERAEAGSEQVALDGKRRQLPDRALTGSRSEAGRLVDGAVRELDRAMRVDDQDQEARRIQDVPQELRIVDK